MSATYEKDLRTGQTFWQSRRLWKIETHALPRDVEADVLVVGAGISGAMTAEALSEVGLPVVVVDRRGALKGSTTASTALLQYEIDVPLSKLAKRIGRDRAERIWRRSYLALSALRDRARRLDIKADIINGNSLYLQGDELDAEGLREEGAARGAQIRGGLSHRKASRSALWHFWPRGASRLRQYVGGSAAPGAGFLNAAIGHERQALLASGDRRDRV